MPMRTNRPREREREGGREKERERERVESNKQAIDSKIILRL